MVFISKKGFTLIELLAVIVILAIILAIAIPGISGIISSSKKGAFEENVKMIIKGAEYKALESTINTSVTAPTTGNITDASVYGGLSSDFTSLCIKSLNPTTICAISSANSKFGSFTATVTKSTVTYAACTCP